jgi:hypothetical protein
MTGARARFGSFPPPSSVAEETEMADLAYAVLLIGGFAILALTLRLLERL